MSESLNPPVKKIHDGADLSFFLRSLAYREIMTFVLQLNRAMVPSQVSGDTVREWRSDSPDISLSESARKLQNLVGALRRLIDDAPSDTGPRRFGNIAFRRWYKLVEEQATALLQAIIPTHLHYALPEIEAYLIGSFGSSQRLDYGTGHELSFLAFLGCLWKLHFFSASQGGEEERGIVIGVFEPYLQLIRELIKIYTLEPAGSHGVWGLDDNSFLPYVFGSAQLCPAITKDQETPTEGSLSNAPDPSIVSKANLVDKERNSNMYFSAVAFINEVKRGPFGEHSPILYDISAVKDGWGKINKGMIKMYNGEVLSKFPVVQHFPFGSFYKWERDPDAKEPVASTHTANQPLRNPLNATTARPETILPSGSGTAAPWTARPAAPPVGMVDGVTRAPWATGTAVHPPPGIRPPRAAAASPFKRPAAPTPRSGVRQPPLPEE